MERHPFHDLDLRASTGQPSPPHLGIGRPHWLLWGVGVVEDLLPQQEVVVQLS